MFHWLKKFFKKETEKPKSVSMPFVLPNENKLEINCIDNLRCKKHLEYNGIKDPINNCNDCWEFHYQKTRIGNHFGK
jgi:hypothetical protein